MNYYLANLNEYIHILSGSKANDSDLGWILNLRINRDARTSAGTRRSSSTILTNPPEVFFKKTLVSSRK